MGSSDAFEAAAGVTAEVEKDCCCGCCETTGRGEDDGEEEEEERGLLLPKLAEMLSL